MDHFGIILRKIRTDNALTLKQAATLIQRSTGWLSELESGKPSAKCSQQEFERVVAAYGVKYDPRNYSHLLRSTSESNSENEVILDGAILKYLRTKSGSSLSEAAEKNSFSKGYLSKLENGSKPISKELRDQLLNSYGYKPSSFKNFSTKDKRSEKVPVTYKLNILLHSMTQNQVTQLFQLVNQLIQKN